MAENDSVEWARAHRACFETEALIEMVAGQRSQIGFTLQMFASVPMDLPPGDERRQAGAAILAKLKSLLEQAVAAQAAEGAGDARVEIEPDRGVVMRPDNKMEPEVVVRARVEHSSAATAVTAGDKDAMSAFTKRLTAMGLKAGRW
jgi:hypothetical protein